MDKAKRKEKTVIILHKNNYMKNFPKFFFGMIAVSSLISMVVRIFQMLYAIDYDTGFYMQGDMTHNLLYTFLVISFLGISILCYLDKNEYEIKPCAESYRILKYTSLIMSAVFGAYGAYQIYNLLNSDDSIKIKPGILEVIEVIFIVLSVLTFLFQWIKSKNSIIDGGVLDLIYSLPIGWATLRLITSFMKFTIVVNMSEHLFSILALSSMLIFILTSSKILSCSISKNTVRLTLISGATTVMYGLLVTIPRYTAIIAKNSFVKGEGVAPEIIDLFLVIYALVVIWIVLKDRNVKTTNKELNISISEMDINDVNEIKNFKHTSNPQISDYFE